MNRFPPTSAGSYARLAGGIAGAEVLACGTAVVVEPAPLRFDVRRLGLAIAPAIMHLQGAADPRVDLGAAATPSGGV